MRYAIVGFGPVGARIGEVASSGGNEVIWYDRADIQSDLPRMATATDAVRGADRVVVAVPATAAADVAVEVGHALAPFAIYEDWTSTNPDLKRDIAQRVGGAYVDITLLDVITAERPLLCVAGASAETVAAELAVFGFEILRILATPGEAATVKMVRSLFMKPFEALSIEFLRTARERDPSGAAIASVARSLRAPFDEFAGTLLETNRRHAGRRSAELAEVISSVSLASGESMLRASEAYLESLAADWLRPDAPPAGATRDQLLAFLGRKEEPR